MNTHSLLVSGCLWITIASTQAATPAPDRSNINADWEDRATLSGESAAAPSGRHTLWYRQPAKAAAPTRHDAPVRKVEPSL